MIVEKRGESKVFEDVWMCLGDKLERRERERPRKTAQNFFVLKNEGFRGIYTGKVTLRLPAHLIGPLATLLTSVVLAFSWSSFLCIFKGLFGLRLS